MTGPIARGVTRAETLQRLAERDRETADFPAYWPLYAHLHLERGAGIAQRHRHAVARDHAVRRPS